MIVAARVLMTVVAFQYGVVPWIVDLSDSHVLNADWPPHARFHMVWLLALGTGLAAHTTRAVWRTTCPGELRRLSWTAWLVLGGFFGAAATHPLYGGALADPEHALTVLGVNGNVLSFSVAAILQGTAIALVRVRKASHEGDPAGPA